MKWLLIFSFILVTYSNAQNTCYDDTVQACNSRSGRDDLRNCNAKFRYLTKNIRVLQKYANHQIEKSFEYLLLSTNFGSYSKNRPGFEKQFRALSDKSWTNGIELIKHIAKRGGTHDFRVKSTNYPETDTFDLNEINSLALALDYEKMLSFEAHYIQERANRPTDYDPEVAHFIEEEFIEVQSSSIRKLSGYINDLQQLLKDAVDITIPLYLFDEYLSKQ